MKTAMYVAFQIFCLDAFRDAPWASGWCLETERRTYSSSAKLTQSLEPLSHVSWAFCTAQSRGSFWREEDFWWQRFSFSRRLVLVVFFGGITMFHYLRAVSHAACGCDNNDVLSLCPRVAWTSTSPLLTMTFGECITWEFIAVAPLAMKIKVVTYPGWFRNLVPAMHHQ